MAHVVYDYRNNKALFSGTHADCNKGLLKQSLLSNKPTVKERQVDVYQVPILPTLYKIYPNEALVPDSKPLLRVSHGD